MNEIFSVTSYEEVILESMNDIFSDDEEYVLCEVIGNILSRIRNLSFDEKDELLYEWKNLNGKIEYNYYQFNNDTYVLKHNLIHRIFVIIRL